jgi:hypothetical protein
MGHGCHDCGRPNGCDCGKNPGLANLLGLVTLEPKLARGALDTPNSGLGSPLLDPTAPHYQRLNPEPITVIEDWGLNFRLGNAVKYISRAGYKGGSGVEDLRKAVTYIEREIAAQEGRRAWK